MSSGVQRRSSAAVSSTRATSPKWRTRRSPVIPRSRSAASARSTRLRRPTVTGVPYGIRDDRQGDDGCSQVGSPSARERARISSFENSNSASGDTTPCSRAACAPGRWPVRSSALVPSATTAIPRSRAQRNQSRPELRLTEVAAVRRVGGVARIVQLVGIDLDDVEADRRGDLTRVRPLAVRIRRAASDDGEDAIGAERGNRDGGEIRRVDAAAVADGNRALRAEPVGEASFFRVGRVIGGRVHHMGNVTAPGGLRACLRRIEECTDDTRRSRKSRSTRASGAPIEIVR